MDKTVLGKIVKRGPKWLSNLKRVEKRQYFMEGNEYFNGFQSKYMAS